MSIFLADAQTSFTLSGSGSDSAIFLVSAATAFTLSGRGSNFGPVGNSVTFSAEATALTEQHYFYASARSRLVLHPWQADTNLGSLLGDSIETVASFSAMASAVKDAVASAHSDVDFSPNATGGRDIHVSAETSMDMAGGTGPNEGILEGDGANLAHFSVTCATTVGTFGTATALAFQVRADCEIELASGVKIPGEGLPNGLRVVLAEGLSGDFPISFAETSRGVLLMANGIDPMLRWDGLASTAQAAGLAAPGSGMDLSGSGAGYILGTRWAYARFIDVFGNVSNLSPVSPAASLGRSSWISSIRVGENRIPVCTAIQHGLANGATVIVSQVADLAIDGQFTAMVLDEDTFALNTTCEPGFTSTPSLLVAGSNQVVFSNVPLPPEPRVVRRQILRNLDGNAEVFYVDIDTTDLTSATLFSSRLDDDLSAQEAVAVRFEHEILAANRFGVPPSHKGVVEYHLGRVFAAVDRPYTFGHIEVSLGSRLVRGVGTQWKASMAGRSLYCEGSFKTHAIEGVREAGQFLILDEPFSGITGKYVRYSIRPSDTERRLVYYSEPNLPEAWPSWNAFAVPEHSDEITGLMVFKSYLYVVEERNISSFTFKSDPGRDGFLFSRANRGCVNDRCKVIVEDSVFMLDEAGVHRFDGESSTHLSARINNLFNDPQYPYRLDWSADRTLWHASQDPVVEIVRWFVDFIGKDRLTHAICYDYRRDRWWLEQYPEAVTSSAVATIGYRRVLAGTTARRVLCLGEGTLDGVSASGYGSLSGTVLSATNTSIVAVPTASGLPASLAGVPFVITSGEAKGEMGIIAEVEGDALTFWHEWETTPAIGDTFRIGGVPWAWRGGWLPYIDEETDNARDLSVVFKPTSSGGSLDATMYFDYADEPRPWGATRTVDGIATIQGRPEIVIDTDKVRGYAIQRIQGRRERYSMSDYFMSVALAGVQGSEPARVFEVVVDGVFSQEKSS